MDRLKGKVILISGGARGQGAAEARLFAAEGARVVIGDVLESEGRQLASELGPGAAFVLQDVTQERD
jgi:3alpha(or 20beta)-hydroxysteroid dehydrogenase